MGKIKHGFNRRIEKDGIKRKFYDRWQNMMTRCFNQNRKDWTNYGGRGIKPDNRWMDFVNFSEDMYKSFLDHVTIFGTKDTTLDRIDVNRGYSKFNCKWATKTEQAESRQKRNHCTYQGKTYLVKDLAKILQRPYTTIWCRLRAGISLEKPYRKSRIINNP